MFPVLILLGGFGTRLGVITKNIPKSMIDIQGKPFIYYQLRFLEENGIRSVTLCMAHLSDQIIDYINKNYEGSISIEYSFDGDNLLGTGGAVKKACQNISTPFFVMYGDSLLDVSLLDVKKTYENSSGPMMVIYKNNDLYDCSNIYKINESFYYNKSNPHPDSSFIDYGLSIFERKHFDDKEMNFCLSELQEAFSSNESLQFYIAKRRFYEIGSIEGLIETREKIASTDTKKNL